jgi:hypothetical protein
MTEHNHQEFSPSVERNSNRPGKWFSIWQLALSLLGSFAFWGIALVVVVVVMRSMFNGAGYVSDSQAMLLIGAGFGFIGLLLVPSAILAVLNLLNKPFPKFDRLPRPTILILLLPLLLGIGYAASQSSTLVWILLPPIHVLTIGVAVLWFVNLGIRGLPAGSAQHLWGVFGTGMVAAPIFSLLLEFVVILGVSVIGIAYLGRDPAFSAELTWLYERFLMNPDLPLDTIYETLQPYLMQPAVIYGGLLVVALLVPLIEEFFKPVGVWLLAGSNPSPSQGFAAGVLSGGGFALFENMTLSASSGEEWALILVSRLGTSIIHILTTGLTGWALALAWREKKYLRLGATYLVAVVIHGLWNGLVVLSIIPGLLPEQIELPEIIMRISMISPFGFLVILAGSFILFLGCNSVLRHAIISPGLEIVD